MLRVSDTMDGLIRALFRGWNVCSVQLGQGLLEGRLHVHLAVDEEVMDRYRTKGDLLESLREQAAAGRAFMARPRGIRHRPGRKRARL